MGIRNMIVRTAGKAADKVAQLSALSPEQKRELDELRGKYLNELPDPVGMDAQEMTLRLLASAGVEIYNAYLPQIKQLYLPLDSKAEYDGEDFHSNYNIRYLNITKWVTDKKENNIEKLVNVYATLSNENCNIALVFHRTCTETEVYLAVTNLKNEYRNGDTNNYQQRLIEALRGNFPGSRWKEPGGVGILPFLKEEKPFSVATASNVPTEKSEKFISQTIEKLLDGIVPDREEKEYTLILLATPVRDVEERKLRLADLYSGLAPFSSWQTSFRYSESESQNSQASIGVNAGGNAGLQKSQNEAQSLSKGETESQTETKTDSHNITETDNESTAKTDSYSKGESKSQGESNAQGTNYSENSNETNTIEGGVKVGWLNAGGSHSKGKGITEGTSNTITHSLSQSVTENIGQSIANTIGHSVAESTGRAISNAFGRALTKTVANTVGSARGINLGVNFGANFARSSNVSATVGRDEGITQSYTNYTVKHTLDVLEEQMKRYEESVALGMWDFAAYVLGENIDVVNNVAHSYVALTQGEKSYLSQASINLWRGDVSEENKAAKEIYEYLKNLRHPIFVIDGEIVKTDRDYLTYPTTITATTSLSGKELAYSLNFPQKSIVGLPVLQCAEFGRNIVSYDDEWNGEKIALGNIFHMNNEETIPVSLAANSLTGHTFITGSTGSGKSNTVFQILSEIKKKGNHFLVVEPAKGEYKTCFGGLPGVSVYGTNPSITPLLRLNPFSFPEHIHILEHLDRLVEIFNVCWPMYAAMPAVLKNAIEKSYEDCGWDLIRSTNEFGDDMYPTFADVARNVKTIIDSSEYDTENKGAYKGSLLTRLQSLSNGINGLIFVTNEIEPAKLFDENVIVDLSRVGSSETKSLLMGMLVLKLQEYRMSSTQVFNNDLKHITVLEEAHNLLKRTSTDQPVEGGNLLGKSVEMLANAIAEMRTYGEGFIIADQAPGLLDMSVIRNTNTKIIMRLPDENDRRIVGLAANLNEDQIKELSRLPRGVAAIYQNEWVQPVLCKVNHFTSSSKQFEYQPSNMDYKNSTNNERIRIFELLSKGDKLEKEVILKEIKPVMDNLQIPASLQIEVYRMLTDPSKEPRMTRLAPIASCVFPEVYSAVEKTVNTSSDEQEWTESANRALNHVCITLNDQVRRDIIQAVVTDYLFLHLNDLNKLRDWSIKGNLI